MANWYSRLTSSLKACGFEQREFSAGDGKLLFTPFAARMFACELPGVEGNLFWHHPTLEDAKTAKATYAAAGGGSGGDRLWLGPEIAFMWKDLKAARVSPFDCYSLPSSMDPSDWRIAEDSAGHLRLSTEIALTDHRFNKRLKVRASRQFDVAGAPPSLPHGVKHVGVAIRNEITLLEADAGAVASAWDLLQVPSEGDLICPTVTPVAMPRSYYSPFGDRHVHSDERRVKFHIDGKHQIKMGLSPAQTTGRMGYLRRVGDVTTLIVRIFQPLPGEPYVDMPRSSDEVFGGDALQAYNDGNMFGGFGEMEFHDAALVAGKTPASRSSTHLTHVLAGADKDVREAGRALLGVEV